jgi:hypothetical protein
MRGRSLGVRTYFLSLQLLFAFAILLAGSSSAFAQDKPADLTGKWNLSWEARLGTEHDPIELKQTDGKLTGTFLGHLGKPNVSGTVDGKNVTLRLEFPGVHSYTLVFTGTIDGGKMGGKFEIANMPMRTIRKEKERARAITRGMRFVFKPMIEFEIISS